MDIKLFNETESIIHRAIQLITILANSCIMPHADDSHTTSKWNPANNTLESKPFKVNRVPYCACVQVKNLIFELKSDDKISDRISFIGKSYYEIKKWLFDQIQKLNHHSNLKDLHYTLPAGYLSDNYAFTAIDPAILSVWINLRTQANEVLYMFNESFQTVSEISIWPHHFDTGVYHPIEVNNEVRTASINAGLAIADSFCDSPYYYISGWNKNKSISLEHAPALNNGTWLQKGNWKGAILPVFNVNRLTNKDIEEFLQVSFQYLHRSALKN